MRPTINVENVYYYVLTNLDVAIITFFILLGIGYLLWAYRSRYLSTVAFFALVTSVFYLPNPIQLSYILTTVFRSDRISLFIAPFFAVVGAIGLYVLFPVHYQE